MLHRLIWEKMKVAPGRRLPFLPRFGFVVEMGNRRLSYRQASLSEALIKLVEKGVSLSNWQRIRDGLLDEIKLEPEKKASTINVKARTLSATTRNRRRKLFKLQG